MNTIEHPDHTVLLFPGLGPDARTAIGNPPGGTDSPIVQEQFKMVAGLAHIDDLLASAKKLGTLTPEGQARHVAPLRAQYEKSLTARHAELAEGAKYNAAEREKLFAIPPGDAATDQGYRERFYALPPGTQRDALWNEIAGGKRDPLLLALARDEFPTPYGDAARGVLRQRAEQEHAAQLANLDAVAAKIEWAQFATGALQHVVNKTAPLFRAVRATEDATW